MVPNSRKVRFNVSYEIQAAFIIIGVEWMFGRTIKLIFFIDGPDLVGCIPYDADVLAYIRRILASCLLRN